MLRRQKIVLGVILLAPAPLSKLRLTKLTFLMRSESSLSNDLSFYHHVPYNQGPFSFTLYRDIADLCQMGYLQDTRLAIENRLSKAVQSLFESLPLATRSEIARIVDRFAALGDKSLLTYVYNKYPWFASRSTLPEAPSLRNAKAELAVYTSGYEGESVDYFFQKLMRAGIEVLIDVRNNPISRKYGFSKGDMRRFCQKLDIRYEHFPELGIPSSMRSSLNSYSDYKRLLEVYESSILPSAGESKSIVADIVASQPSALVCFEKNVHFCHRGRLANTIADKVGLGVKHL